MDPLVFDVTIEIPGGSRNKYEVDHTSGRIRLGPNALHLNPLPPRLRLYRRHPWALMAIHWTPW